MDLPPSIDSARPLRSEISSIVIVIHSNDAGAIASGIQGVSQLSAVWP